MSLYWDLKQLRTKDKPGPVIQWDGLDIRPFHRGIADFWQHWGNRREIWFALPAIYPGEGVVLLVAILFYRIKLPEINEDMLVEDDRLIRKPLFHHRHFVFAVIAQFFYVAAQTGVNSFFINYVTDPQLNLHITDV